MAILESLGNHHGCKRSLKTLGMTLEMAEKAIGGKRVTKTGSTMVTTKPVNNGSKGGKECNLGL
jgi:hypothetical protein